MRPVEVTEDDVARIDALAEAAVVVELLKDLRGTARRRPRASSFEDGTEIAAAGRGETVVRKRIDRGSPGCRR